MLADLWGSLGVIVAGLIVHFTGWIYADALIALAIGGFILPRAFRLAARAGRILVQAAPEHIDVEQLRSELLAIPDVEESTTSTCGRSPPAWTCLQSI